MGLRICEFHRTIFNKKSSFQMCTQALSTGTPLGSGERKHAKMLNFQFFLEGIWLCTFPAAACSSGFSSAWVWKLTRILHNRANGPITVSYLLASKRKMKSQASPWKEIVRLAPQLLQMPPKEMAPKSLAMGANRAQHSRISWDHASKEAALPGCTGTHSHSSLWLSTETANKTGSSQVLPYWD